MSLSVCACPVKRRRYDERELSEADDERSRDVNKETSSDTIGQ